MASKTALRLGQTFELDVQGLGHEGQGVSDELMRRSTLQVRIAQPGGEESLNVATAAAICLHASATAAEMK